MSKVMVDQEKCIGCGACVAIDPENFDFNEEGLSTVVKEEANDKAKEAEEACPTFAINIVSEEDSENNSNDCDCGKDCDCSDECECTNEHCECGDECECTNEHCECGDECHCTDDEHCGCKEKDE